MHTETIDRLRIESRLAESFCIGIDDHGSRLVAMNGYVVDYPTFCTMLIWYMSNTMGFSRILENRPGIKQTLVSLNQWDKTLESMDRNHAINHVYKRMFKPLRTLDKKDVATRLLLILNDT